MSKTSRTELINDMFTSLVYMASEFFWILTIDWTIWPNITPPPPHTTCCIIRLLDLSNVQSIPSQSIYIFIDFLFHPDCFIAQLILLFHTLLTLPISEVHDTTIVLGTVVDSRIREVILMGRLGLFGSTPFLVGGRYPCGRESKISDCFS